MNSQHWAIALIIDTHNLSVGIRNIRLQNTHTYEYGVSHVCVRIGGHVHLKILLNAWLNCEHFIATLLAFRRTDSTCAHSTHNIGVVSSHLFIYTKFTMARQNSHAQLNWLCSRLNISHINMNIEHCHHRSARKWNEKSKPSHAVKSHF